MISYKTKYAFSPVPNRLLEQLMLQDFSPYETRLVLYLLRQTFGYHRTFCSGFPRSSLAKKTQIPRAAIYRTIDSLVVKGVIEEDEERGLKFIRQDTNKKGRSQTP